MHLDCCIGDRSTCHRSEAIDYSLWILHCLSSCPKCQGWPSEYVSKNLWCRLGNVIDEKKGNAREQGVDHDIGRFACRQGRIHL